MTGKEMIEQFVCPGCMCGSSPGDCGKPLRSEFNFTKCTKHVCGTSMLGGPRFALGLPKGFCKAGVKGSGQITDDFYENTMLIRCWCKPHRPEWNRLNIAVWAMEKDDFLFVRTFMPRINWSAVDVIEEGTLELTPNALNVAEFIDEID
jgi:hypothetical protein